MAMPPTPAPAAGPAAGADPTMAGGAPPDDMGAADDDAGSDKPVLFTVMGDPAGPYTLVPGDEDEGGDAGPPAAGGAPMAAGGDESATQGQSFDTPQALMQGIMKLLSPDAGAEDSFAKGFKGEPDDTAGAKPPGM